MVEVLCSLVYLVMESMYWPDDWRWSYIVPLFKAGDEEVAGNIGDSSGELCGQHNDKGVGR